MTETTETSTIQIIERTIAQLSAKREGAIKRSKEIAAAQAELSFAVHADEDKVARGKLDKLNAEEASLAGETKGIGDALAEANKRLAAAHQAAEVEAAKANALEVRKLLASFAEAARDADAVLQDFNASVEEMRRALNAIHAHGVPFPTQMQLMALGKYCLLTHLNRSPWAREFEVISPSQRREFSPLVAQWCSMIEKNHLAPLFAEQTAASEAPATAAEHRAAASAILADLEPLGAEIDASRSHPDLRRKIAELTRALLTALGAAGLNSNNAALPNLGFHVGSNADLLKALTTTVMAFGVGLESKDRQSFTALLQAFAKAIRAALAQHNDNERVAA